MQDSFKNSLLIITLIGAVSCNKQRNDGLKLFADYYSAVKENSDKQWNYTSDTVKLWFDEKSGEPILQIKGDKSTGKWKEWDIELNSTSSYDSLWLDQENNVIMGYFYENNDFYELIGKAPTKTLRTYWLNEQTKINEILIYWIPDDNTTTSKHLKPIKEWALENDSIEINQLYPDNTIIPSRENARRWKKLLNNYNESH